MELFTSFIVPFAYNKTHGDRAGKGDDHEGEDDTMHDETIAITIVDEARPTFTARLLPQHAGRVEQRPEYQRPRNEHCNT